MDLRQPFALALVLTIAFAASSAITLGACRWWYGRRLAAAAERFEKVHQGRLFAREQTAQAIKQIERLKTEVEALQQSAVATETARRRAAHVQAALAAEERRAASAPVVPVVSAHGFADTQVLG